MDYIISREDIRQFNMHLKITERSGATIGQYVRVAGKLYEYSEGKGVSKNSLLEWKQQLSQRYAVSSANAYIAAANSFFRFMEWEQFIIKPFKRQKEIFMNEKKELTKEEYRKLVETACRSGRKRLSLVMHSICSTGIRISELNFITVEAVKEGRAEVSCKGKRRIVFLPKKLRALLKNYIKEENKITGPVFTSKSGRPLNRSNIWREMKGLCRYAGVSGEKVYPHNFRYLFAKSYYSMEKDIVKLADLLGHFNINTTRIYIMESGRKHAQQIEKLGLIIT